MGGRGKAGKIKLAAGGAAGREVAREILATPMPPNRQNPQGEPINSLLVEEKLDIIKEAYCAIAIDRARTQARLHREPLSAAWISKKSPSSIPSRSSSFTSTPRSATRRSSVASSRSRAKLDPGYRKAFPAIAGALYDLFFRLRRQPRRDQSARAHERRARDRVGCEGRARRRRALPQSRVRAVASRRCRWTKTRRSRCAPAWASATSAAFRERSARWPTARAWRWRRWMPWTTPAASRELPRRRRRRQRRARAQLLRARREQHRRASVSSSTSSAASRAAMKSRAASSTRWRRPRRARFRWSFA